MKTVKILSLTLLMSVLFAGMTFAQQQGQKTPRVKATPEERAAKRVEMMKQSLNLTPDQVTKLQSVQTEFAKNQDQAQAAKKGNQQDMKAKREAYDAQVKSILTPEQYQKYQDQRTSMIKKGGAGAKKGKMNKSGNSKGQWSKDKKQATVQ